MSEFILPESATIVDPITSSECTSLGNNTGLNINDGENNCQALSTRLMPLLAQIVGDISSGKMTIYANDDSKCSPDDKSPTLASMMSRIYRVSEALTCILCSYDPTLANLLTSGSYPQVLMGKAVGGSYPQWVTPDSAPTENSYNLVTSGGVHQAIREAIMSVWHIWDKGDNGEFQYLVNDPSDLPVSGNTNGDYAICFNTSTSVNTIYKWENASWVLKETLQPSDIENFAVMHIVKGEYADRGLYWFETSWNVMDADIRDLEARVAVLEASNLATVKPLDNSTEYRVAVVNSYSDATSIQPTLGQTKIIFVRGQ